MNDQKYQLSPLSFLRLQSWLSPTFPSGAYSYSHGIEWAVEVGNIHDRGSLVDWLDADLCHGSGRNEAIFFKEAYRCAASEELNQLGDVAELAAAFRGTPEFALESSQQAAAYLATLSRAWPDRVLDVLSDLIRTRKIQPVAAVVLGIRSAAEGIPVSIALPAFLHSYTANLVSAGVKLIPLGQTDGELAVAALEDAFLLASAQAERATFEDAGSAAVMIDFASIAHETQYTRLFRS